SLMAEELVMPRLSDTMERGTIARWLKREGDAFTSGEVLAEIETDKALMELNAYDDGVLLRILVPDGGEADLGAPIAIVGQAGEEVPDPPAGAPGEPVAGPPVDADPGAPSSAPTTSQIRGNLLCS
ncbi:MAG: biotin/lipoyl-containing protein, partial [Bacteroidota bacterium]